MRRSRRFTTSAIRVPSHSRRCMPAISWSRQKRRRKN
jgi:hypothetical protein